MKTIILMTIAGLIVASTPADLTGFSWHGGVATDNKGDLILDEAATILTILDIDMSTLIQDGQIELSVLQAAEPALYDAQSLRVAPQILGGRFQCETIWGDGSVAGSTAYALIINRAGLASFSQIQDGDYIGFIEESYLIYDLHNSLTPQAFGTTSDVSTHIQVVPEPSSVWLMGFGAGSLLFYRRAKRRQQEQQHTNRRSFK